MLKSVKAKTFLLEIEVKNAYSSMMEVQFENVLGWVLWFLVSKEIGEYDCVDFCRGFFS